MTLMDLSLLILAVCTLVQLGFFLFDRWERTRYMHRPVQLTMPSSSGKFGLGHNFDLVFTGYVCLLVGVLLKRYIDTHWAD